MTGKCSWLHSEVCESMHVFIIQRWVSCSMESKLVATLTSYNIRYDKQVCTWITGKRFWPLHYHRTNHHNNNQIRIRKGWCLFCKSLLLPYWVCVCSHRLYNFVLLILCSYVNIKEGMKSWGYSRWLLKEKINNGSYN